MISEGSCDTEDWSKVVSKPYSNYPTCSQRVNS